MRTYKEWLCGIVGVIAIALIPILGRGTSTATTTTTTTTTTYPTYTNHTTPTLSWQGEEGCRNHLIARNDTGQKAVDDLCTWMGKNGY